VDEEVVKKVLHEYKLFNVELVLREPITVDQLLDIIEGNRKYVKCLYVYNKIDLLSIEELDEIARRPMSVPISAHSELNFDGLLERAWQELALTRVYTKPKGEFPDFDGPVVLTPQRGTGETTVENAVLQIHRGLLKEMKSALVWGTSVRSSPQICSLKHVLEDEDVIQVVKMTAAEMARARHGKKTGQCHAGTGIAMEKKHGTTSKAEKIVGGKSTAHR
jgi:ribosome-interacting GTPase 1